MQNILIFCLLLLFFSIIFGIVGLVTYLLISAIWRKITPNQFQLYQKRLKIIAIAVVTIFTLLSLYISYTAVYPTDNFYYREFETVTLRKIPDSAHIITKKATYPDLHGDYSSDAVIELSANDFQTLLNNLSQDKRLTRLPPNKPNELVVFQRIIDGREDKWLFITFYKDKKTINVHIDIT